jgi:DNA-binding NtrC family response regulator
VAERILIVDDEVETLIIFQNLLKRLGCEVHAADSMEAAEALLTTTFYSVVITDLRLTGILGQEGLEILRFVKEKHAATDVILVTGYGSPEIMSEAYRLGAACYFEKPVHPLRLLEAVQESLNERTAGRNR